MMRSSFQWLTPITDGTAISRLRWTLVGIFLTGLLLRLGFLLFSPARETAEHLISLLFQWTEMPLQPAGLLTKFYTPVTALLVHWNPLDFLFSIFGLYFIGNHFQYLMSDRRVWPFFFISGLIGYLFAFGFAQIPVALTEGMKNVLVSGASPAIIGMLTVSAYLYPNMPVQFPLIGKIRISVIFVVQIMVMVLYLVFAPNQTAIILAQTGSMIFSMLYARSFRNGNDWLRPFLRKKTFRVATDESQIRRIQVKIMHGRALQDDEYNTLRKQREATLDELLDKISAKGLNSLTREERELLDRYSKQ